MGGLIHVGAWTGEEYVGDKRRLLLFEPQAEAFALLRANCPNAELVNAAVGATNGTATMNTAHPSNSSSLLVSRGDVFDGTEQVRLTTLDKAMRGRKRFDTLRIDTQGYELEVLRGATGTLERLERVELELHDPNTYRGAALLPELDEFMAAQGFVRTVLNVNGSDGLGDVVYERGKQDG